DAAGYQALITKLTEQDSRLQDMADNLARMQAPTPIRTLWRTMLGRR
ncbi:MAG: hypothetical protein QOG73_4948, partial [Acetobacteraceae bacterium]|nr:hypothetical protein [Acetobacteraceae bacterium]